MPIIKSAIKEVRSDRRKTDRNRRQRARLHNAIRKVEDLKNAKKEAVGKISEALKKAYKAIDKAVKKNLLHANTAARRKSRLSKIAKAVATKK